MTQQFNPLGNNGKGDFDIVGAGTGSSGISQSQADLRYDRQMQSRRFTAPNRSNNASLANEAVLPRKIAIFGDNHVELGAFTYYFQREVSRFPKQKMIGVKTATSSLEVVGQWVPAYSVLFGAVTQPITTSGGVQGSSGPAGYSMDLSIGSWIQFGDGSRYLSTSAKFYGVGSFDVTIDGVFVTNITLTSGQSYSTSVAAEGAHTYQFTATAVSSAWGAFMYDGNETIGVQPWQFGHTGWTTANHLANTYDAAILAAEPFDVIILATGTNDVSAANYNTQMTSWITTVQTAQPLATVFVWFPHEATSHPWTSAGRDFARQFPNTFSNLGLIDAYEVIGSISPDTYDLTDDGVHLNTRGAKVNGELMADTIIGYEVRTDTPVMANGVSGGQTVYGGTATTESLTLYSNSTDLTTGGVNVNGGGLAFYAQGGTFTTALRNSIRPFPNGATFDYFAPSVNVLQLNTTIAFSQSPTGFGMGSIFTNQATWTNTSGIVANLTSMRSFFAAPIYRADAAAITGGTNHADFTSTPQATAINNGSNTGITTFGFISNLALSATLGATVSVSSRIGYQFTNTTFGGAGTTSLSSQIGIDIAALTAGGTNIGARIAGASQASLQLSSTSGGTGHGITFGGLSGDALIYRQSLKTLKYDHNMILPFNGLVRGNTTAAATLAVPGTDYLASTGVARITASETAPASPQVGDIWMQLTYA